jgi:hypothetical protein
MPSRSLSGRGEWKLKVLVSENEVLRKFYGTNDNRFTAIYSLDFIHRPYVLQP